jgi:DNA-binding transcriptional ArsR family regulator
VKISDPKAIRALAHPLRLDLLETLAVTGPATAAECGRVLSVPQANCSFHLRQLARHGFVEEAPQGEDRRERRWQLPATQARIRVSSAGGAFVQRQLEQLVVERETQAVLDYLPHRAGDDPRWRAANGAVAAVALLDADEAAALKRQWLALLEPYLARVASEPRPGQRLTRYFMTATPMANVNPGDDDNEPGH